jgi:hypothetical protein
MSDTKESATDRKAREVAELLEALLPEVRSSVAHANDELSMRVARAARSVAGVANAVEAAGLVMYSD